MFSVRMKSYTRLIMESMEQADDFWLIITLRISQSAFVWRAMWTSDTTCKSLCHMWQKALTDNTISLVWLQRGSIFEIDRLRINWTWNNRSPTWHNETPVELSRLGLSEGRVIWSDSPLKNPVGARAGDLPRRLSGRVMVFHCSTEGSQCVQSKKSFIQVSPNNWDIYIRHDKSRWYGSILASPYFQGHDAFFVIQESTTSLTGRIEVKCSLMYIPPICGI